MIVIPIIHAGASASRPIYAIHLSDARDYREVKTRNPALVSGRELSSGPPGARELSSGAGSLSCSDAAVLAAERGEEEAVLAWLDGGGRADATCERGEVSGLTLLMGAARYGQERVVELLLRHGAKINLQNSDGGPR